MDSCKTLAEIEIIKQKICLASTAATTALHNLIFGITGDRKNESIVGQTRVKFSMTYRDVEDSIRTFSGKDTYPIERWIAEFEETSDLAQLHEMLLKRKLKKEESLQEYYLLMKELASRGKIESEALIQYIIDGIVDDTQNKLVLYGAKKLSDFKEKLKTYEVIHKNNSEKTNCKTVREKDDASKKSGTAKKNVAPKKKIQNRRRDASIAELKGISQRTARRS
ncbi:hypothetical protein ALC62_12891 [Cyphomyrmex costatus]|uniref:Retrotransposon gag domain-containing protein n=1 Tax=Cyphomyrmex costatus TaxID=456900 RepID=A0A151IAH5_9HYME|nr:hypothetical protein ALC62_12891 [Cyphomyrmex costatus]